jgi:acetoin utilization deacetylase AcuC-like enzyme
MISIAMKSFYHPKFEAPIGEHIMPIRKFHLIAEKLKTLPQIELLEPSPISDSDLLRVHTAEYIAAIKSGEPRSLAESQKFPWSPELFSSVCLTNGALLAASRAALKEGVASALVSGFHHSHADHGEGFCTFNGLIVTAERLKTENLIQNIAILDLDLHYGNGTASLASSRPWIHSLSIYGNDYDQNKPYIDVKIRHHEDGENHHSIAIPKKAGFKEFIPLLEQGFQWLLSRPKIDLLLFQAGADPYFEDPYSPLKLTMEDLQERDRRVFEFAKNNKIPIAWVLAGGYTRDIEKVVQVHVNTFHAAQSVFGSS